jgi:hypothetical protein
LVNIKANAKGGKGEKRLVKLTANDVPGRKNIVRTAI